MSNRHFNDAMRTMYSPTNPTDVGSKRESWDERCDLDEKPVAARGGDFGDLDDFDDTGTKPASTPRQYGPSPVATTADPLTRSGQQKTVKTVPAGMVGCPACNATGKWGRYAAKCFKCDGTGQITTRQMGAVKAKVTREQNIKQWHADHATEIAWLNKSAERGFRIAAQLLADLTEMHTLTDAKVAKIREWMQKDVERAAARKAEQVAAAPVMQATGIEKALKNAIDAGLKNPKLRLGQFVFTVAKAASANAGAVYVKGKGADGIYYGKIMGGRFLCSRECPSSLIPEIELAAKDPAEAAVAYGLKTGICGCCGAELTNHESIARGIGPICAEKWGF